MVSFGFENIISRSKLESNKPLHYNIARDTLLSIIFLVFKSVVV